jgi:hypothetical protein
MIDFEGGVGVALERRGALLGGFAFMGDIA